MQLKQRLQLMMMREASWLDGRDSRLAVFQQQQGYHQDQHR